MVRDGIKYDTAVALRTDGVSIREIAKRLSISTSTASIWCKNIELTVEQKEVLSKKSQNTDLLRFYAQKRHFDKVEKNQIITNRAFEDIGQLTEKEFFVAGLALYWAEGFKNISEGRVGFCNSDPRMIKFMVKWFQKFLNTPLTDFTLRVEFNASHSHRQTQIESYWSALTSIPSDQFNKPYLQKTPQKRKYENEKTYFGVLRIRIRRSTALLVKMRGWISGIAAY